jgi:serine/threonine protein kinase/TolA-binding protein
MSGSLPEQFGKYQLIQRIGTGGMAEIFKAKVTGEGGFEKLVAIKRILPHLSDDAEFVDMFMREARLAALLSHPNIVQIYDFGKERNTYYIAMEYLWGHDLRTVLNRAKEQPLPIECALYIASRISAGLEYSHNLKDLSGKPLNIIHRDVNPQNIIVTHQGEVKIVDFGIAKIAEMDSTTKVGTLKGKVPYMSPEQAAGEVIDKRSDIFSTGVILYEMVTGEKAFQGATMEVLDRVRKAEFKPPELAAPDVLPEVHEILHKALAKTPENRFQTSAEMFRRLEDCLTLFSKRQNAENLSRQIRLIFADDLLDTRSQDLATLCPATPSARGSAVAERTETVVVEDIPPSADAATPPVKLAVFSRPRLWVSAVLLAALLLGVTYYRYAMLQEKRSELEIGGETAASQKPNEGVPAPGQENVVSKPAPSQQPAADNATILLSQGLERMTSDPEGARSLIEKSIQANPSQVEGHFELGKVHSRLGGYDEAVKCYQRVIELDPKHAKAYFNLGFLYASMRNYAHGEEMFSKVVALSPGFLDEAYFNLAVMQRGQGKTQDSIQSMEHAVAVNPGNSPAAEYLKRWKEEG